MTYLIHEHDDDGQLSQNLEGQRAPRDDGVLEAETKKEEPNENTKIKLKNRTVEQKNCFEKPKAAIKKTESTKKWLFFRCF